jgi:hypothetical protein
MYERESSGSVSVGLVGVYVDVYVYVCCQRQRNILRYRKANISNNIDVYIFTIYFYSGTR